MLDARPYAKLYKFLLHRVVVETTQSEKIDNWEFHLENKKKRNCENHLLDLTQMTKGQEEEHGLDNYNKQLHETNLVCMYLEWFVSLHC